MNPARSGGPMFKRAFGGINEISESQPEATMASPATPSRPSNKTSEVVGVLTGSSDDVELALWVEVHDEDSQATLGRATGQAQDDTSFSDAALRESAAMI